ncbi:MAG: STM4015 family protein [Peptococcaceae bacterium]|nr:STM4015 family protein [Peptococcaceae bacterium]
MNTTSLIIGIILLLALAISVAIGLKGGPKVKFLLFIACVVVFIGIMIYEPGLRTPKNIIMFVIALLGVMVGLGATSGGSAKQSENDMEAEPLAVWLPDQNGKKYDFEFENTPEPLAEKILTDEDLPKLKHIVIGAWGESYENNPDPILTMMIDNKERFRHIESLFIGDMDYDECEISWIIQSDRYGDLLQALPRLRTLKIRGSTNLSLGNAPEHADLEDLQIVCGGLPKNIATELQKSKLPRLTKLTLYMGVPDYGLTCTIEDLAALADKNLFPNLRELGFVNSQTQDEIVAMLLASNILPQLETLDISYGCLTDKGGKMILDAESQLTGLKNLIINYHFMSEDMVNKLQDLPFDVNESDRQDYDEIDDIYPMITE